MAAVADSAIPQTINSPISNTTTLITNGSGNWKNW